MRASSETRTSKLLRQSTLSIFLTCIIFFLCRPYLGADPDLFARVAVGHLILQKGWIQYTDPFSFLETKPLWVDHEWLSGVIFYLFSQRGGDFTFLLAKFVLIFWTVFFLNAAREIKEQDLPREAFFDQVCFGLLVISSSYIWFSTLRAQVFTYLFVSIEFYLLNAYKRSRKHRGLFFLSVLFLLWPNLHGGVILGFLIWICFLSELRTVSLLMVGLFWTGLVSLNPYGLQYFHYLLSALTLQREGISEWKSVSIFSPLGVYYSLVILAVLSSVRWNLRRLAVSEVLLLIGFSVLAFLHLRLGAMFFFTCAVYFPKAIGESFFKFLPVKIKSFPGEAARKVLFLSTSFQVLLVFLGCLTIIVFPKKLDYGKYPLQAANCLRQNVGVHRQRLLVDFNQGSFMLWRLYPKYLVSFDGRYEEVYYNQSLADVRCALSADCARQGQVLEELKPDFIFFDKYSRCRGNEPLCDRHTAVLKDWFIQFEDEFFRVYGKKPPFSCNLQEISELRSMIWDPTW